MKRMRYFLFTLGAVVAAVYLANASWLASSSGEQPYLVAHRGVHQTFDNLGVGRDDCTAHLIGPPEHDYIENTIPSIRAAHAAGALWVEIDIHPTANGDFAVFHDWTLDCRTDGTGVVREQTMHYLRGLDAGWGYTHDGGETYPLRGAGVGAIASLKEVLTEFPGAKFVLDFKGGHPREAERLSEYLIKVNPSALDRIAVIGGTLPVKRFTELHPQVRGGDAQTLRTCLVRYLLTGWSGLVPSACHNSVLIIPNNYTHFLWGWPNRFEKRMAAVDSEVWVMGDWTQGQPTTGLDTRAEFSALHARFSGGVWTNKVEIFGGDYPAQRPSLTD